MLAKCMGESRWIFRIYTFWLQKRNILVKLCDSKIEFITILVASHTLYSTEGWKLGKIFFEHNLKPVWCWTGPTALQLFGFQLTKKNQEDHKCCPEAELHAIFSWPGYHNGGQPEAFTRPSSRIRPKKAEQAVQISFVFQIIPSYLKKQLSVS